MGPILIFDKSTLQSLNVDESVWLDAHYLVNITPLFFVETLSDLEKEIKNGRTAEDIVGNLAEKTPTGGRPNVHHESLCIAELLGNSVTMDGRPVVGGGKPVFSGDKSGIVFDQAPEIDALHRWEQKQFLEIERKVAKGWRKALSNLDLDSLYQLGKIAIAQHNRPKNLREVKILADSLIRKPNSRFVRNLLPYLIPEDFKEVIKKLLNNTGNISLMTYAPYTAHVLTVDLFFCIALGANLIARTRPSHKIDMAYLYYLPFCMVFTSNDNLHIKTAPLFMNDKQVFVRGVDLKSDLAKLDKHYSALPQKIKDRGVISFAAYPPTEGDFLVANLWDKLMSPSW